MIADLLVSRFSGVLCGAQNFRSPPISVILARLNRAELGEFDALVLGLFLMAHCPGHLVIPDFGFYGREVHEPAKRIG